MLSMLKHGSIDCFCLLVFAVEVIQQSKIAHAYENLGVCLS